MVFGLFGSKKEHHSKPSHKGGRKMAAKKSFGGYGISFKGREETLEQIFGSKPIPPHEMTKKLWAFVKKHNLGKKG